MRWSNRKTHSLVNNSQTASLRFRSVFDICSSSSGLPESPNTFNQWPSCREKYIDNYMCSWKISLVFYCLHVLVHQRRGTQPGKKFGGCVLGDWILGVFHWVWAYFMPFYPFVTGTDSLGVEPQEPNNLTTPMDWSFGTVASVFCAFSQNHSF